MSRKTVLAEYLVHKTKAMRRRRLLTAIGLFLLGAGTLLAYGGVVYLLFNSAGFGLACAGVLLFTGVPIAFLLLEVPEWTRIVLTPLIAGPRALVEGWRQLSLALGRRKIDYSTCAAILNVLLKRGERVSFDDLDRAIHENSGTVMKAVHQLLLFDGVMHLRSLPGLTLTSDFRNELLEAYADAKERGHTDSEYSPSELDAI
jgi:hypothetical protein